MSMLIVLGLGYFVLCAAGCFIIDRYGPQSFNGQVLSMVGWVLSVLCLYVIILIHRL